jgi:TetR/AcrR family transcriptional regulator, regulator of autoinduction and epiphytic fitness
MIQPKIAMKKRHQLSPEKAEAILTGGMQEFLAHGYAGTSMDRLATVAGVSKATVYSYFQDKEGLFTALIEQLVQGKFRSIICSNFHRCARPFCDRPRDIAW